MLRRVVVTGLGVVTSLGCELGEFWERICAGKSGIGAIRRFDCSAFKVRFGGELNGFNLADHMQLLEKDIRRMDRFVQFAMAAAQKATAHAQFDSSQLNLDQVGAYIGSGIGGLNEIEQQHSMLFDRGPTKVSPLMIPKLMVNAASGNISVHWKLRGPCSAIATACASATNAIGDAFRLIQYGHADMMIAGGSEAAVTPMGLSGFARMQALSTRSDQPEAASRPFDKGRDGFVMAEGAGVCVLEEYEHAVRRGAPIVAELIGYGMSADGNHMTAPDPEGRGAARAMALALKDARVGVDQVDYINAHGTSTPLGDLAETVAIKTVFGEQARRVAVSSTKSQLGHLLGASGGVEFVISALAIRDQIAPPTINLDEPDEGCDLDYVPHQARSMPINIVLTNSFGFGGHNACLVLKKI